MEEILTEPILETTVEEVAPVIIAEEPKEEPANEATSEKQVKTISLEQWKDLQVAKRSEIPQELHRDFNAFVKSKSASYGAELPKNLSPETRFVFVEEVFKHIKYDPIRGFFVDTNPEQVPF
jgi:hypothetical protein